MSWVKNFLKINKRGGTSITDQRVSVEFKKLISVNLFLQRCIIIKLRQQLIGSLLFKANSGAKWFVGPRRVVQS